LQVKQKLDEAVWKKLQNDYVGYLQLHPKMTPTEKFILLNRTMEKAHYGITMRDLARGYEIDYVENDGRFLEVQSQVRGVVKIGGPGNNSPGVEPSVAFHRTSWKVTDGKPMSYMELVQDKEIKRTINLATEHTTGTDIGAAGTALLEHEGIDTGFGATPGVITPYFVDMMMRKFAEKTVFKNFVRQFPMPGMAFYYPLKTTIPSDDTSAVAHDLMPTAEGRAGVDVAISFDKTYVNGWKWLRHAVFTDELLDLLSGFIPVQAEYVEDMGEMMALLWDYAIVEGLWQMLWAAKWWRPGVAGTAWAASEYVPLSGASGVNILTTNAYKHWLWADIGTGATGGNMYTPHGTTTDEYLTGVLRNFSSTSDTPFEIALALASLLKDKKSKLEWICWPTKITEYIARDARFLETIQATGNPEFQSESGYLGQIAIGGTNGRTDVWEYDMALSQSTKQTGDVGLYTILPIYGGRYNSVWNLGMYTPLYFRADEGMEVAVDRGTGDSETLRPNETKMITAGTKGASFPGNYQDLVMALCVEDNHG
jgi:hypothetical protein